MRTPLVRLGCVPVIVVCLGLACRRRSKRRSEFGIACDHLGTRGCVGGHPRPGRDSAHRAGSRSESLDPTATYANESILVIKNMYEMLYDSTPNGQGFVPVLATGYTLSPNKLAWSFHLRPGVEFANGKPLTSADVKFSFMRASKKKSVWAFIDAAISNITTPTASTVVIHTKVPVAGMLAIVSLYGNAVIPANYGGVSEKQFFQHPIGTGPFLFKSWTRGQSLTVTRNTHYWQKGKPYLDSIVWSVVPDNTDPVPPAPGRPDRCRRVPGVLADRRRSRPPPGSSSSRCRRRVWTSCCSTRRTSRSRISMCERPSISAIDRASLVKAALFGHGSPAGTFPGTQHPAGDAGRSPSVQPCAGESRDGEVDRAQGIQHHAEHCCWVGDGCGHRPGSATGARPARDQGDAPEARPQHVVRQHHRVQSRCRRSTSTRTSPTRASSCSRSPEHRVSGTGWKNPALVSLANKASTPFDPAKRKSMYAQFVRGFAASYATAPIFQSPWLYAISSKVNGFSVLLTGNYHASDIWLSK